MNEIKPSDDGTGNVLWYEGEFGGRRWTFDAEDGDLAYIESSIAAWKAWKDYVKKHPEEFAGE